MPKFNTLYNRVSAGSIKFVNPSKTQQHFRDECDINHIMKRYESTGYLTDPLRPATRQPLFGDFANIPDLREAQDVLIDAQNRFDELPARVRRRFNNDPAELLDFLNNPVNFDEAVSLGLVEAPKASEDSNVSSVPPASSEAPPASSTGASE